MSVVSRIFFFFFNDTATTEIYTLSLHDALPISFVPSIVVNAGLGNYLMRGVSGTARRLLLTSGIAFNLALLAFFKYASFLIDNLNTLLSTGIPVLHITLPIG